jgi:hypothetical protein
VVKFTGIELTGNSGNPVEITFPQLKSIDLLNQSDTASAVLFDQPIPAGSYGDQTDSAVTFNPVKTGILVTAKQTTTVDIP